MCCPKVVVAEAMSQLGSKQKAAMSVWLLLRFVTDSQQPLGQNRRQIFSLLGKLIISPCSN